MEPSAALKSVTQPLPANDEPHPIPDSHGINLFTVDPDLARLLRIYLPDDVYRHVQPQLLRLGELAGGRLDDLALVADKNPPVLRPRTRTGKEEFSLEKHPAYVELEKCAFSEFGLAAMAHRGGVFGWSEPLPPAVKYGLTFLFVQAEFGLCCPVSMTDSLTRTLRKYGAPALVARFLPMLTTQDFEKLYQGSMFITEQGAGSDVSAVTTSAVQRGDHWELTGEKWFCSNADAELAMVLARPEGAQAGLKGLALFLLPRYLPDGSRNHYTLIRLKDKLGSRSMASGEILLNGAHAYLVGGLGRGWNNMTEMINMSRLSNGVRAAGLMRRALTEGLFVAKNRVAFRKRLVDMPLMQRQLVKMMVFAEQARSFFFQTATCLERGDRGDAESRQLVRILTPMIKFRACRDARKVTGDGMEVRGGSGYIEEWSDPRIVRDAHLGSIWEGTSNIVALDVARSIRRENTLPDLQRYLDRLLSADAIPAASRQILGQSLQRTARFMQAAVDSGDAADIRQSASALYHVSSAVFLAWEAAQLAPDHRRLALAHLVLRHRVLPRDPLVSDTSADEQAVLQALLDEGAPVSAEAAAKLLPADRR